MGNSGSKKRDEVASLKIIDITVEKHFETIIDKPGVTAIDDGQRGDSVKGPDSKKGGIKVFVESKEAHEELKKDQKIPKKLDGIKVDIEEGKGHLLGAPSDWLKKWQKERPTGATQPPPTYHGPEQINDEQLKNMKPVTSLRGGDSIGIIESKEVRASIGYFIKKGNQIGLLINGHVAGAIDTRVISPSWKDGGKSTDYVGTTKTVVVTEEVDCAFVRCRSKMTNFSLYDGSKVKGVAVPKVGDQIKFFGFASGRPVGGYVKNNEWEGDIDGLRWSKQIQLSVPALPGDAGALVVKSDTNEAVGMIFANAEGLAIANQIRMVLNALGAELAMDEKEDEK